MLPFISVLFRYVLLDLIQLALGCLFIAAANMIRAKGFAIRATSLSQKRVVIVATSFIGVLLPLSAFGAIPVAAAFWIIGLDLPLIIPFIISNFLFNFSLPLSQVLTQNVFIWSSIPVKILVALLAGAIAGLIVLHKAEQSERLLRASSYGVLFEDQVKEKNYLRILRRYFETAGLFIFAAAVLNTAFSLFADYWLYDKFLGTGFGMSLEDTLSTLNVFNPYFDTAQFILQRLIDFSALGALLLLFKTKSTVKFYGFFIIIIALLSVSLWIR